MWRPIATLASGVLYGALFPPFSWDPLAWVALVPLALALRGCSFAGAAGLGALFGWVATLAVIPWLVPTLSGHFERPLWFAVLFWLLFATTALAPYYAILLGGQAWAARRLPAALGPWLFAAAWTSAEWLRMELGFRSPWTRLGDAGIDWIRLRQIAELAGVFGLSFLIALANGVLADLCWRFRRGPAPGGPRLAGWIGVAGLAVALLAAWGYGANRLEAERSQMRTTLDVALVQGNVAPELRWRRVTASKVLRRYGGLTRELGREGLPALVIWPENAVQTTLDDPVYGAALLGLARGTRLVVGAPYRERVGSERRDFNSAFLLRDGQVEARYDKRRLLPFSETRPLGALGALGSRGDLDADEYTPGVEPVLFAVEGHDFAPLICMEALYPSLAREAADAGARALIVLSNDGWFRGRGAAEQHLAMVRFRAIETRLPVVRATTTGVSAIIAPDGEVLGQLGAGESGTLRRDLPLGSGSPTPYGRIGDAFALGCILSSAAAIVLAWRRERRRT